MKSEESESRMPVVVCWNRLATVGMADVRSYLKMVVPAVTEEVGL